MGKNKTRSKSALKQNSVTAENKRLGDDGNINFTFKILSAMGHYHSFGALLQRRCVADV